MRTLLILLMIICLATFSYAEEIQLEEKEVSSDLVVEITLSELSERLEKGEAVDGVYKVDTSEIYLYETEAWTVGKFKDGEWDGIHKSYENGILTSESYYKNGKQDGVQKGYFKNGQLGFEANFKDGKVYGNSKNYDENGQLRFFVERNKEKIISVKSYFETGALELEKTYNDAGNLVSEKNTIKMAN